MGSMKYFLLVGVLTVALAGCGSKERNAPGDQGFDAFNSLEVRKESVPTYRPDSRQWSVGAVDRPMVDTMYAKAEFKNITEEQAKKVIADFISKHQDKYDHVLMGVNDHMYYYVGEFFANSFAEECYRGPARAESYPVLYYTKTSAKG